MERRSSQGSGSVQSQRSYGSPYQMPGLVTVTTNLTNSSKITKKLCIGGKDNTATGVGIELQIDGPTDEVDLAYEYIKTIGNIQILPTNIQKINIKTLIFKAHELTELSCMSANKPQIIKSLVSFFQNTIDAMPLHPIQCGNPGYKAFTSEHLEINNLIAYINQKLTQKSITIKLLSVKQSTQRSIKSTAFKVSALPPDLDSFLNSINVSVACKTQWEGYFSNFLSNDISLYFNNDIPSFIQSSSKPAEMEEYLNWKLKRFVDVLEKNTSHFCINILKDVVNKSDSPTDSPAAFNCAPQESQTAILTNQLLVKLDSLVIKTTTFNQDFFNFRESLTQGLENNPEFKDMILSKLQNHLNNKPVASGSRTLKEYINQSITRISQPLPLDFSPAFDVMQRDYTNASVLSRKHNKLFFLGALKDKIKDYPEKSYAECYQLTKSIMPPAIQAMLNERLPYRFFSHPQHRFKDFITALSQSDTNYSTLYPS